MPSFNVSASPSSSASSSPSSSFTSISAPHVTSAFLKNILIDDVNNHQLRPTVRIVQERFEGLQKCNCCINWIKENPSARDIGIIAKDEVFPVVPATTPPMLIARYRKAKGPGINRWILHSIDVRDVQVRCILMRVFEGLDCLQDRIPHLHLLAPFHPFFWRWEAFEKAFHAQSAGPVHQALAHIHSLVKAELAGAFACRDSLAHLGLVTWENVWTLYEPGRLLYAQHMGVDRFFIGGPCNSPMIDPFSPMADPQRFNYDFRFSVSARHVDYDGFGFGYNTQTFFISEFSGPRPIKSLPIYPVAYMGHEQEVANIRARCLARGRKFARLAGFRYVAYEPQDRRKPTRRIMFDSEEAAKVGDLRPLHEVPKMQLTTGFLCQQSSTPFRPHGHAPLGPMRLPPAVYDPAGPGLPADDDDGGDDELASRLKDARSWSQTIRRHRSYDSILSISSQADTEPEVCRDERDELTELQLLTCPARKRGFDLDKRGFRTFDVQRTHEIEFMPSPLSEMVLPPGMEAAMTTVIESVEHYRPANHVLRNEESGTAMLLLGRRGSGKAFTGWAAAEMLKKPLITVDFAKIEHRLTRDEVDCEDCHLPDSDDHIIHVTELAVRWKAVLLLENVQWLAPHGSRCSYRLFDHILRVMQFYPALVILTAPSLYSLELAIRARVHATFSLDPLGLDARRVAWLRELAWDGTCVVLDDHDLERLALTEMDGRRIKLTAELARERVRLRALELGEGQTLSMADIEPFLTVQAMDLS